MTVVRLYAASGFGSRALNRLEKIVQVAQRGAKDKHEGGGYQYEHQKKGALEDKANLMANIFPSVRM